LSAFESPYFYLSFTLVLQDDTNSSQTKETSAQLCAKFST